MRIAARGDIRPGDGVVDWHTHAVSPELGAPPDGGGYPWPTTRRLDPTRAVMEVGGRHYRDLDDRCWSVPRRLTDMDAEDVEIQVLSPVPITLCHDAPAEPAAAYARAQNDVLAAMVAQAPDRLAALGAVPLQDPPAAVAELRRAVGELGFVGVEVGTRAGARELSDPALDPFFDAAQALGAVVFVHPVDGTLDPRLASAGLAFGVGMPTETAVAGAGLLTAGTLARRPGLRVCLAHGGGALPAVLPRVARGQQLAGGEATVLAAARSLWCDSLTYDAVSLRLGLERVGPGHVVLGTDYPFAAREVPAGAVLGALDPGSRARVGRDNGTALLTPADRPERELR